MTRQDAQAARKSKSDAQTGHRPLSLSEWQDGASPATWRGVIPIRTVSGLNVREHWAKRSRRVKAERFATFVELHRIARVIPRLPVVVTLVRRATRLLDTDNLPGSMKAVRDQIAEFFGVTDGPAETRIRWVYGQEKGPAAVLVTIERMPMPSDLSPANGFTYGPWSP